MVSWLAFRKVSKPIANTRKIMDMVRARVVFAATINRITDTTTASATSVVKGPH
jgi:hypothetical protein